MIRLDPFAFIEHQVVRRWLDSLHLVWMSETVPRPFYPMDWQNLNEENELYLRSRVVAVAQNIANGQLGIVAGARKFGKYTHHAGVGADPDFIFFIGIDCETDSFPLGDVRQLWRADELQAKDRELAAYENRIRERTLEACRRLIQKYSGRQANDLATAVAMPPNVRFSDSMVLRS